MNVDIIIQARTGSTRLPEKVLTDICGHSLLERIVLRARRADTVRSVAVATSILSQDNRIEELCNAMPVPCLCWRGSESDVLDRYYQCATRLGSDAVVRLTGDNPFIDPEIIDEAVRYFIERNELDYLSYRAGLPLGAAVEVFSFDALSEAWRDSTDPECREHVTPYLYRNGEKFLWEKAPCLGEDLSDYRLTVDTEEDLETSIGIITAMDDSLYGSVWDAVCALKNDEKLIRNAEVSQKKVMYGALDSKARAAE